MSTSESNAVRPDFSTWAYRGFWTAPADPDAKTAFVVELSPEDDEVDPAEWPRWIAYMRTLPEVLTVEPDDVEPFL